MFTGPSQGWGITRNEDVLYVSDGSEKIYTFNADTLEPISSFTVVTHSGKLVKNLNELEFVNGLIWANVFTTDYVISIDPTSGVVQKMINMASLLQTEKAYNKGENDRMRGWDNGNNVLNGIAHDPESGDFFFTGKRWSLFFRIKIY